jgi:hypothetical protein
MDGGALSTGKVLVVISGPLLQPEIIVKASTKHGVKLTRRSFFMCKSKHNCARIASCKHCAT